MQQQVPAGDCSKTQAHCVCCLACLEATDLLLRLLIACVHNAGLTPGYKGRTQCQQEAVNVIFDVNSKALRWQKEKSAGFHKAVEVHSVTVKLQ